MVRTWPTLGASAAAAALVLGVGGFRLEFGADAPALPQDRAAQSLMAGDDDAQRHGRTIDWFGPDGQLSERGRDLLKVLRGPPSSPLAAHPQLRPPIDGSTHPGRRAGANLLLSAALVEASRKVATGRVPPAVEYLDPTLAPTSPSAGRILEKFRTASSVSAHFEAMEPQNPIYVSLKAGLRRYREAWGKLPSTSISTANVLKLGDRGAAVDSLFRRLGFDHEPGRPFGEELAAKLSKFQKVHALRATGRADEATLEALNRGSAHYEAIIAANLERARWLPNDLGSKFVLVNTAAGRVFAYEDGHPTLKMKAVVGSAQRPTPAFADRIEAIVVSPEWNVPPHLARSVFAPNVLRYGPGYLEENGYTVLSDWSDRAVPADPAKVDWRAVSEGQAFVRLRQRPGPSNPMGDMKFMFPNRLGIYLHDTPDGELFEQRARYLSNGCVRLEDPRGLAEFLGSSTGLAERTGRRTEFRLKESVPVYAAHFTFWAQGGAMSFHPDVYGKDPVLMARFGL